jgi:hypothetical protein
MGKTFPYEKKQRWLIRSNKREGMMDLAHLAHLAHLSYLSHHSHLAQ